MVLTRHKSSLGSTFLNRRFTGISLSAPANESESSEQLRGSLGLNLLYDPSEPLIDFIFVHGLRGGSRKTWSKSSDPAHFWPKQWLPTESRLKNVRIFSYGYNSDWGEKQGSAATVHDFGQALLGDIHNTLCFSKDAPKNPLVLIGHSMGGVVLKKVVLLARQDPLYHHVAARVHSLFFLATPHRGADSAQLLSNMLKIAVPIGSKAYLDSLIPSSDAIQVINDGFRHAYQGIQLWSFFETVPTSLGLIVEKNSAILDLPGERVQLLNADHRNVCKFNDPSDSNYCTLRNAFISTVDSIESTWYSSKKADHQQEMRLLSIYLGISHSPEDDLANILDSQMEGSGRWLIENSNFLGWRSGLEAQPKLFWLSGNPATGKSTLAGHIVRHLEQMNGDCASFFFKHHTAGRSTISDMLCSLAWQMASLNTEIRRSLLAMMNEDVAIDRTDERSLWRSIFISRIFRVYLRQPLFWIIDSIDESTRPTSFFPLLAKIDAQFPLLVFVTSRPSLALERAVAHDQIPLYNEVITHDRSLGDIALYVQARAHIFTCESDSVREKLVERILEKSNGNFLWATLVVRELEGAMSEQRVQDILESVPEEINELYARIFKQLLVSPKEAKVVTTIFRWIVCASRPLTVEELKEALRLEIHEVLPQLEKTLSAICGNLVNVDLQMRVCLAHQTVAEYLYQEDGPSEIVIRRNEAHSQLAKVCLDYMQGDELKVPRHRRGSALTKQRKRSAFSEYAIRHFSDHVARAFSSRDSLLMDLYNFLRSTSLVWLELVVTAQDLSPLTITAKNLKLYLERRMKYQAPIGQHIGHISEWANDLVHLAAQCGKAMIASPSTVSHLIPPICPKKSSIYQAFYDFYPRGLRLVGLSQEQWDERLCCLDFSGVQALSVTSRDNKYALGMSNGFLSIYNESSFQEQSRLNHGEPVRQLAFGNTSLYIASAGRKKISLWNTSSSVQMWTADLAALPMAVEFDENDTVLMAATRANTLGFWAVESGKELDMSQFSDINEDDQSEYHYNRPPICVRFASNLNLLGVAYRQRPISFWDLGESSFVGQYHKTGAVYPEPLIHDFIFNPNPEICLCAVTYEADVVVFDPFTQHTIADYKTQASSLAASPDGSILATGSGDGVIKIFDFETLKLLYQINSNQQDIRALSFNSNNQRLLDLRGSQFNVWEPSILAYRSPARDDSSLNISESLNEGPEAVSNALMDEDLTITAITTHHDSKHLFCGRENGTMAIYSSNTGSEIQSISGHDLDMAIVRFQWNESCNILLAVDISGGYSMQRITKEERENFQYHVVLQKVAIQAQQIILSPAADRILVSTVNDHALWDLEGALIAKEEVAELPAHRLWKQNPTESDKVLLITDQQIRTCEWTNLQQCSEPLPIQLHDAALTTPPLLCAEATASGRTLSIYHPADRSRGLAPSMRVFPTQNISSRADVLQPVASFDDVAKDIKCIIGTHKSLLIYLSQQGWLCSINIDDISPEKFYTRHFFIPLQWHSNRDQLAMCVTNKGCIALAVKSEIAVFHNGLNFEERVGCKGTPVSARASMRSVMKRGTSEPAPTSVPVVAGIR